LARLVAISLNYPNVTDLTLFRRVAELCSEQLFLLSPTITVATSIQTCETLAENTSQADAQNNNASICSRQEESD
jgi:hypothetical protein